MHLIKLPVKCNVTDKKKLQYLISDIFNRQKFITSQLICCILVHK